VSNPAPLLSIRGLSKSFGETIAVQPLDLDIFAGDFLAILGPSGCGKTTLLRMLGGFTTPTSGTIHIDGQDVTNAFPEHRPTNMVFQGYGLFPHMNVRQNVAFGLRMQGIEKSESNARVSEALKLVRMDSLTERLLTEISGGQQQRVALARALVLKPKVLLLDEPLGALDLKLRKTMQEELRTIHKEIGGTFVIVTHDQEEAMGLADRIAVMNNGAVEQLGPPEQIYSNPATKFVATFIGEANLLAGKRAGNRVLLRAGTEFSSQGPDGDLVAVIRPEAVKISESEPGSALKAQGTVKDCVFGGASTTLSVELASGEIIRLSVPYRRETGFPASGTPVSVTWDAVDMKILPDAS
jgi:spermidine/putrescine transport system ATP-binding protein